MTIKEKEKWIMYASVISSQKKTMIIKVLHMKPMTPTQIQRKTQLSLSYTSTLLKKLVKNKILICLNPKSRKGKLFTLSENGKWVYDQLD